MDSVLYQTKSSADSEEAWDILEEEAHILSDLISRGAIMIGGKIPDPLVTITLVGWEDPDSNTSGVVLNK